MHLVEATHNVVQQLQPQCEGRCTTKTALSEGATSLSGLLVIACTSLKLKFGSMVKSIWVVMRRRVVLMAATPQHQHGTATPPRFVTPSAVAINGGVLTWALLGQARQQALLAWQTPDSLARTVAPLLLAQ
jgi:hypothetical protein